MAILLTSVSVKILDDYLDREEDLERNLSSILLGQEFWIYGVLTLSLACAAHLKVALALFWAAYVTGMVGPAPTGIWQHSSLRMAQEAAAVIAVSMLVNGLDLAATSLLVVVGVQFADNAADSVSFIHSGLDVIQSAAAACICFLLGTLLNPALTLSVGGAALLIWSLESCVKANCKGGDYDESGHSGSHLCLWSVLGIYCRKGDRGEEGLEPGYVSRPAGRLDKNA
ncbi:MAG: hypothetical protein AB1497_06845 [Bacillota bacterium]